MIYLDDLDIESSFTTTSYGRDIDKGEVKEHLSYYFNEPLCTNAIECLKRHYLPDKSFVITKIEYGKKFYYGLCIVNDEWAPITICREAYLFDEKRVFNKAFRIEQIIVGKFKR